jgi:hypothetical protein
MVARRIEEAREIGTLHDLSREAGLDEIQGIFMSHKELVGFTPIELAKGSARLH